MWLSVWESKEVLWFACPFCSCLVSFLSGVPGASLQRQAGAELIVATCSISSPEAYSLITAAALELSPCCRPLSDLQLCYSSWWSCLPAFPPARWLCKTVPSNLPRTLPVLPNYCFHLMSWTFSPLVFTTDNPSYFPLAFGHGYLLFTCMTVPETLRVLQMGLILLLWWTITEDLAPLFPYLLQDQLLAAPALACLTFFFSACRATASDVVFLRIILMMTISPTLLLFILTSSS